MFDRSTDDDDGRHDDEDDDDDYDDGSYKDTRHSESVCALSQSTANGHVSSPGAPPSVRVKSRRRRRSPLPPPPPFAIIIQCLRLAANIAQFVVIIQDIEPHNVRRHHQFQNVDGYAKSGRGGGRGQGNPIRLQPELLLHIKARERERKRELTC